REGVGGAQKLLPMHVVYEYCSNEPFYPVPKFTSQPNSSKQFYNWTTDKKENWFRIDSRLAVDRAIYKGRGAGHARPRLGITGGRAGGADLVALKALCKVRTKDFIDLKSQLEDHMALNNHHQVSQI
ncbi:F-box protein, partial [Legionella pneumophila serogroup 2]